MSGVSLVLLVAIMTVLLVLKTDRSGSAALQALVVQKELADEFRADVAGAASAPDEFGRLKAGRECLLLRRSDGDIIVYRWESGVLERSALSSAAPARRPLPVGGTDTVPEFDRSGLGRRLLTLRLKPAASVRLQPVEVTAALGGDTR
jgi:hypothetical protein